MNDFGTMQNRASPVVLEWWVGNVSCEKAKKTNMDYFCQENSVCNDVLHGSKKKQVGYRCECAQGYKGNAYLPMAERFDKTVKTVAHMHKRPLQVRHQMTMEDPRFNTRVSDFGISKFIPIDQTHVQTLVHGTLGYIDPEYFRSGFLTEKSDVYSFGMFLVELLTGRKVFSHDGTESDLGLAMFFVSSLERGSLIQIVDHQLKEHMLNEHVKHVAKLAKECVELEGKKRPSMEKVRKELKEIRESYITVSTVYDNINSIGTNHLISFD
ncbi:wall-associated receptor kinase 2-like protein [Tanacetum coccineum]